MDKSSPQSSRTDHLLGNRQTLGRVDLHPRAQPTLPDADGIGSPRFSPSRF
jgi:hypothetical protein